MKRPKRWILILLPCVLLFGLARLYYYLTDDFRIGNITYDFPFTPQWQTPLLTEEEQKTLVEVLSQPFRYIGKGAQCYAFVSKDEKYVIKFFKFKHLKPNWLAEQLFFLPFFHQYRDQLAARKHRKLVGVFNGYDLAFRENRKNTQLLYVHLVPTKFLHVKTSLFDKIGWEREVYLDDVVFLVQKKGKTLRSCLHEWLKKENLLKAKEGLAQIFNMYISEYHNGLYDHDHGVLQNTGFVDGLPFHLDVGKLHKNHEIQELAKYKYDLQFIMYKIVTWIHHCYPQFEEEITSFLSDSYEKFAEEKINFAELDPSSLKKNLL